MNYFKDEQREEMPDFDYSIIKKLHDSKSYIVSPPLRKAVQIAMHLGQPLLLTGEPGTGKTQLAYHLAYHFNPDFDIEKEGNRLPDNFFVFFTKTTSGASDLFYRYEALKHFQAIQSKQDGKELKDVEVETRFIKYQALGEAIRSGKRCVVLIDEIDKAPRDLPNDILNALEKLQFEVPEINKTGTKGIAASQKHRPIVILTSNSEKNLPDAFLRRCVYFHINWDDIPLEDILQKKTTDFSTEQLRAAISHFQKIRGWCKRKKPSTAELIQWISILEECKIDPTKLDKEEQLTTDERDDLKVSYGLLIKDKEDQRIIGDKLKI